MMDCQDHDKEQACGTDQKQLALLESLPRDVMNTVLSYLYLEEYDILSLVSRHLGTAVSDSTHLVMNNACSHNLTSTGLCKLLKRFVRLNVLSLRGLGQVGDGLLDIVNDSETANSLKSLSLRGCCLSYWCHYHPQQHQLHNLMHLTITGGAIRTAAFGELIQEVKRNSPIQTLTIGQCSSLTDDHIMDIMKNDAQNSTLLEITLHQCLHIKKPCFHHERLHKLQLLGCFSIVDLPNFHCPALLHLSLTFTSLPGHVIQHVVSKHAPSLQCLQLINCTGLTSLSGLHSNSLQQLNVSLCNSLQRLTIDYAPQLRVLETASCSALQVLGVHSMSMSELNLSMLPLNELSLHIPSLKVLKLCGNTVLSDNNGQIRCPQLEFVDICGTEIQSPSLMFRSSVCLRMGQHHRVGNGFCG